MLNVPEVTFLLPTAPPAIGVATNENVPVALLADARPSAIHLGRSEKSSKTRTFQD